MATLKVPEVVPSPTEDCERLRKAFQGLGTDEKAIIWILGHRNASQRKKIRDTYQQLYNEFLIDRLHSELSGDFRNAVILWTYEPPERDAKLARNALKARSKGTKQLEVLVEIACASSPHHLMSVRHAYFLLFDCSLEEDIVSSVSQPLRKFLLGLVGSYRYDNEAVDLEVASSEAETLHEAIKTKKLDHDHVVWILCMRNFFQLRSTFAYYRETYGNPIEEDIMKCGNSVLRSLLKVVIWCINSPEKHFAKVVRDSIAGLGTDEDSLTRAIVTRAEIDMLKVRTEYAYMYKSKLDDAVIGDTSGDYKKFLMTLLGARM
ncbi:Annexin [Quillaja saponaria]|uniref:Annexin n=1 Tax=Quillaja saponaria TaxID=32244 RepID=A0AAD7QIW2_QUISA|nr:Annexin [Quillaja saponaria]